MMQEHNVFISWSGERSLIVASELREWLPMVVQTARPWLSDSDIDKGSRWLSELTKALSVSTVGISCLTAESLDSPWLLFEAGALSKAIETTRLCTYLLDGLKPEDIKQPLGMFQATRATKDETRKLVHTINVAISATPVKEERLDQVFEAMWPLLEKAIKELPAISAKTPIKRDQGEMIAEILELLRSGVVRKPIETSTEIVDSKRPMPSLGVTPIQIRQIIDEINTAQRFIAELVGHAKYWGMADGTLTMYFSPDKRPFGEMTQGKDVVAKIRNAARKVLGKEVAVQTEITLD
jgi:hypothetical protein